ncbi:MAG: peptidylprolyl isomerase [Alteromonadaceae bacterium]|jgi:peptidyl-prolyl cis-trans isomerase A (cyclophilin A)
MYKATPKTLAGAFALATLFSFASNATIVEFETSQGNFKINLHDQTTPKTVENFLKYINEGDYNNTVVHRLVPDFIVQAGGYSFDGDFPLTAISTDPAVLNEPIYSNVRGTIAMAKVGGNPNSATSQWFINYKDNSANLDAQNGGFTVFGEVTGGMDNLDNIALLPICSEIPMPEYTSTECEDADFVPGVDNFVTIYTVTIINDSATTDASLASVKNTSLNNEESSGSGGGSFSYFTLCVLSIFGLRRKVKKL